MPPRPCLPLADGASPFTNGAWDRARTATHRGGMIDQSFDILIGEVGVPHFGNLTMVMNSDHIGVLRILENASSITCHQLWKYYSGPDSHCYSKNVSKL